MAEKMMNKTWVLMLRSFKFGTGTDIIENQMIAVHFDHNED